MKGKKWSAGQLHRVNGFGEAAAPAEIKTGNDLYFGLYLQGIKALQADSVGGKLENIAAERCAPCQGEDKKILPNC